MSHGTTCPNCGSRVKPDQIACGQCKYRFSSRDEEDEDQDWDMDDRVTLTEEDEFDEEDFEDAGGGTIMEDDPNAERESFDGEQEDDWDPPLDDDNQEDQDAEGGESGLDGRGSD